MRTKDLSDLIEIRNKGEGLYRQACLNPPVIVLRPFQGDASFVDHFLLLSFRVILSFHVPSALWSTARKGLTS